MFAKAAILKVDTNFNRKAFSLFSNGKSDFSVIKFLLIYFLLLFSFYAYVGITSGEGKYFSPFLNKYADFPDWITIGIARTGKLLLELTGYSVYQKNAANITIAGATGVTIGWACLGAGAMSLWIGFIAAHKCALPFKLKWILSGLFLICFINVLRVIMIALSNYYRWGYASHFNAHTSFNLITYVFILVLMYIFMRSFNRTKQELSASLI